MESLDGITIQTLFIAYKKTYVKEEQKTGATDGLTVR